ncbi:MAG: M1 family metallopeptidase [Candidatus Paceibacterota bacterium]
MKKKNLPRSKKGVRLSKNVIPVKYDIQLRPDLKNFTFEGIETITLLVLKRTKKLVLHSKELKIETAQIFLKGDKYFAKISYDEKSETASFLFPGFIPAGKTKLTLVFKGILNDKMRGFYKSKYNILDKEYCMATTQFEATDARRAFPCFDEPAQKAVFHVCLVVPKGQTAISNTLPVSIKEHEAGFEIVQFSPTPKMSTYLLAFIVGNFEYIEKKTKRGVIVRVYTTPGKKHQAKFALLVTVRTLEFYEKYFDIPYPLNTLDMIAIPDFQSGAMENWGAITYRESALLVDEDHSSISNKQWVALVIAHELAHQWFGNLVTMKWWTHLWLNEGFASYVEYLAVDQLFPEWDIWTQFSTNELGTALRLDSLLHTHAIEIPVHHPNEIGEIFDEVSYSKGSSIIRMLADYLGEKDFRDGLRYYLKKHSYKNTETAHLWEAFEKVSRKSVAKMMKNWTGKPGYPVVKAEIINGKLSLAQERFFASPISRRKNTSKTKWKVPISLKSHPSLLAYFLIGNLSPQACGANFSGRRPAKGLSKSTPATRDGKWLKINFGEAGFYRTAYSPELLEKLKKPVEKKLLSARDRLGIIRDLFALSEAGIIQTTDALEFLASYKREDHYTVWVEIASGLARLEQLLAKTSLAGNLDKFTLSLFSPTLKRLGWNPRKGELHTDTLLRPLAISRIGGAGDKKTIAQARKKFSALQGGALINPNVRSSIYTIVATHGGTREYNALIKMYKKETLHEEKNRIGSALGDFKNLALLEKTCQFGLSPNVRTQDTIGILASVGANPIGRDIWIKFIQKNWPTLLSRYGDGGHTLPRLVKAISGSSEEKHLKSFKKFFATHPAPGAQRAIEQVKERLECNIVWLKRDRGGIEKFLKTCLK